MVHRIRYLILFLLIALLPAGCAQRTTPATRSAEAPTPVETVPYGGIADPDTYAAPEEFRAALVRALSERDTARLEKWMSEPFLTGTWTADMSDTPPADALKELTGGRLRAGQRLALVPGADLFALLGGIDPLAIPRAEAGVVDAFLVSGWGAEGHDEALLFVTRQPDNALKWHGWLEFRGGLSGARLGGSKIYINDELGIGMYLLNGFEASQTSASAVLILAPGAGHPSDDRVGIFITAEPASGQTAEQVAATVAEEAKAGLGAGYTGAQITALGIDGEAAFSVNQLPGQDFNRQLFIVHKDVLYRLMFVPDNPNAGAYQQMEDAYGLIVNTLRFVK